jgi:bifunctional ADP-heptose synthase (sugar kinase/adenylyltransferase)
MISAPRTRPSRPVLIDPKGSDYSRYARCHGHHAQPCGVATSDWPLARRDLSLLDHGPKPARKNLKLDALLLTRSEEDMSLFDAQGADRTCPHKAREKCLT